MQRAITTLSKQVTLKIGVDMNSVVVFDIDGTIADNSNRKHFVEQKPKDWKSYNAFMDKDEPINDIIDLLWVLNDSGDSIILCTGREEIYRPTTWMWLEQHRIADKIYDLYMRPENDYRSDAVVKVELLKRIEADYGRPRLWFDDRQQVVDAIRAEGIRVLQVAPGNF